MTAGIAYSSYVRPSTHVIHIGRLQPGVITPLTNIAAPTIDRLPGDLQAQLKRAFWKRHEGSTGWDAKYEAQSWLESEVRELEANRVGIAFDDYEIRQRAERAADLCSRMGRIEVMQGHARSLGIDPPEVSKKITRIGVAKRLGCPRWWRRQMRKRYTRKAETHLRAIGLVHRHRQVYASDRAVAWRRERKVRDSALLQELVAVSDAGDQLNLFEVAEKSQANPALRRAELMTRLSGFEDVAKLAGHEALFVTPTTPSAYHRKLANGSDNPLWENFSPRDGQSWLSKMWARARAKLARLSVMFYGFRIAEPHHDGTPHWHMVLFAAAHQMQTLRDVLSGVWLSEYAKEAGAQKHRIEFKAINPFQGSATGYLAKYVAKNIDGFRVGDDYETQGQSAAESCDRVAAWASAHGIRQFQQIGGPGVSVWRELRRIPVECGTSPAIEAARKAADAGEWADFVAAVGGIEVGRRGCVDLWKECSGELTQYEELRAPQVVGVCAVDRAAVPVPLPSLAQWRCKLVRRFAWADRTTARVRTRCKVWRIQRKAGNGGDRSLPPLGPVSITVRELKSVPSVRVTGEQDSSSIRGSPWMN
jgi:hypothetical protein